MKAGVITFGVFLLVIGLLGMVKLIPSTANIPTRLALALIFVGVVISFIGLAMPKLKGIMELSTDAQNMRSCPSCGRLIPLDADICPYCDRKLTIFEDPYSPSE